MTVNTQGKVQILIEELEARHEDHLKSSAEMAKINQGLYDRVKKLELEIRGFAGGTVYRKSHEDVSKELGALRRYAENILK